MVAKRLVGPYGQRPTLADGERPSKGVASSHKSRAGSARDGKGRRERKRGMGETGDRKKRKQHVAHCAAPANTSNNHSNHDRGSSSRNGSSSRGDAASVTPTTGVFQLKELANKGKLLFRRQKDFALVQLCKLQSFGEGSSQAFKGERAMIGDNNSLGELFLDRIQPTSRGLPQVEVTLDINGNGTLDVSPRDESAPSVLPRRRPLRLTPFSTALISLVVESTV